VISIFRTFGYLNHLLVSTALSVVNYDDFPTAVADHVRQSESDMLIVPWWRVSRSDGGDQGQGSPQNPFDSVFGKPVGADMTSAVVYTDLIRKIFQRSPADVSVFVDRGVSGAEGASVQHLVLPFFGGPDDRLALSFVVQLCGNSNVSATVVWLTKTDGGLSPVSTIHQIKVANMSPQLVSGFDKSISHMSWSLMDLHRLWQLELIRFMARRTPKHAWRRTQRIICCGIGIRRRRRLIRLRWRLHCLG
jgi:hypothetical protein